MREQFFRLVSCNLQLQPRFSGKRCPQQLVFPAHGAFCSAARRASPLRRQLLAFAPHRHIALDVALRVQNQIPRAGIWKQVVDGVRHHPAQPAEAVGPADRNPPHPSHVVERRSGRERGHFRFWRVQLSWCQSSAVSSKLMSCTGRFKQVGQRGGLHVRNSFGLRHLSFPRFGQGFLVGHGAKPHPDYSLEVEHLNRGPSARYKPQNPQGD